MKRHGGWGKGVRILRLAAGGAEAACEHVLMLLPQLRLYNDLRKELSSRINTVLNEISTDEQIVGHRDVNLLRSLPGVGRCVAATMLAEASQALTERDYHALRRYSGVAPITRSSGKRQSVLMRKSCNGRLRNAMSHWERRIEMTAHGGGFAVKFEAIGVELPPEPPKTKRGRPRTISLATELTDGNFGT
ncbi:MAG: transposase [Acidobacteriota bacterium]|jgi:transposase